MSVSVTRTLWMEQGIEWLLDQWGLYLNSPGIDIGFDHSAPFAPRSYGVHALIDDELVDAINHWLNDLKRGRRAEDHQKADVIELHHLRRKSFVKISEEMRMSRPSLMLIYAQATSWIDSKVDDYYKLSTAKRRVIRLLMKAS